MTNLNNEWNNARMVAAFWLTLACMLLVLLTSCSTVKYVPVETTSVRTEFVERTDTVTLVDSVYEYQREVVREVDSAYMAELGIHMQIAQRAWLVERSQLKNELSKANERFNYIESIHDSIEVPVIVEVEKKLTKWEQIKIDLFVPLVGIAVCWLLMIVLMSRHYKNPTNRYD